MSRIGPEIETFLSMQGRRDKETKSESILPVEEIVTYL